MNLRSRWGEVAAYLLGLIAPLAVTAMALLLLLGKAAPIVASHATQPPLAVGPALATATTATRAALPPSSAVSQPPVVTPQPSTAMSPPLQAPPVVGRDASTVATGGGQQAGLASSEIAAASSGVSVAGATVRLARAGAPGSVLLLPIAGGGVALLAGFVLRRQTSLE